MADPAPRKLSDTTLYRIAPGIGFNARVEPIWYTYSRLEMRLGFFERWREKRRTRKLVGSINQSLRKAGADPAGWDERTGECVCNLRVARQGIVAELKRFLRDNLGTPVTAELGHAMALRDSACLLLPVEFPAPFTASPGGGQDALPVASAPKLRLELGRADGELELRRSFPLKKMVDYLDATERDIAAYESRFGDIENFWAKFGFLLLGKLVDVSAEKGLPVILA